MLIPKGLAGHAALILGRTDRSNDTVVRNFLCPLNFAEKKEWELMILEPHTLIFNVDLH